jgi:hypothetical protein
MDFRADKSHIIDLRDFLGVSGPTFHCFLRSCKDNLCTNYYIGSYEVS